MRKGAEAFFDILEKCEKRPIAHLRGGQSEICFQNCIKLKTVELYQISNLRIGPTEEKSHFSILFQMFWS